ncbi:hypothetical protein ACQKMD_20970 [Viridibacillus sp. NPDC096237]
MEAAVKSDFNTNRRTEESYSQVELANKVVLPVERIQLSESGYIEFDSAE